MTLGKLLKASGLQWMCRAGKRASSRKQHRLRDGVARMAPRHITRQEDVGKPPGCSASILPRPLRTMLVCGSPPTQGCG